MKTCLKRNTVLLAALASALAPLATSGATLCVNPGGTGGCFATIASAVEAAAPDGDTIAVAAGTYAETNIVIDKSVAIEGAGAGATVVDGSAGGVNAGIVFRYSRFSADNAAIRDLTVTGGRRGIDLNSGNEVTLERLRVTGNGPETGAGIFNGSSTMHLRNSLVDANFATDTGSIAGCDWGGASGGGIASLCGGGTNYISRSSIVNNTAGRWGGGIMVNDGVTVIENSTISGNQANFPDPGLAGGAIFMGGGFPDVLVLFSTIANNGAVGAGGLQGDAKMKLYATLLQGNAGNACTGSITSLGYNVVSDASCGFTATGDAQSTDAMLLALADNGGPTPTHEIPAASPAFDRVPIADCLSFEDQRGIVRPQHGACDGGAVEHVPTATELVVMLAGEVSGVGPGGSLAAKVAAVLASISSGETGAACGKLSALRNEVNAQTGKKITAAQAAAILTALDQVAAAVGC